MRALRRVTEGKEDIVRDSNGKSAAALPTPDAPEYGAFGSHGVLLSEAKRWVEDGVYVIRSLEFDVWGEGEDWDSALADFGECLRAYTRHLAMLAHEGVSTLDEREQKSIAITRMAEVIEIHDRELQRRLNWPWRRNRQHDSGWQPPSTLENSHLVSVG